MGSGAGDGVSVSILVDDGTSLLTLVADAEGDGIKVVGGEGGQSALPAESGGNGNGEPSPVGSGSWSIAASSSRSSQVLLIRFPSGLEIG